MITNPGKNGLENWTRLFRNLKSLFLTLITQIWIKSTSKATYSYSAGRNLSIGAWYDLFWTKIFFDFFGPKGGPLPQKLTKIIFLQIWSNHAPIDRSRRAEWKYMVFEVLFIHFWVICVQNSVFRFPKSPFQFSSPFSRRLLVILIK